MIRYLLFFASILGSCNHQNSSKTNISSIQLKNFGSNRVFLVGYFDFTDLKTAKKTSCKILNLEQEIHLDGYILPGGQMYLVDNSQLFMELLESKKKLSIKIDDFEGALIITEESKKNLIFNILPNTIIYDL